MRPWCFSVFENLSRWFSVPNMRYVKQFGQNQVGKETVRLKYTMCIGKWNRQSGLFKPGSIKILFRDILLCYPISESSWKSITLAQQHNDGVKIMQHGKSEKTGVVLPKGCKRSNRHANDMYTMGKAKRRKTI